MNAARLAETPFHSPQLPLREVSATEWRLFWRLADLPDWPTAIAPAGLLT